MMPKRVTQPPRPESVSPGVRELMQSLPVPAALLDSSLRYRCANRPYAELHGMSPDALVGAAFDAIAGAENAPKAQAALARGLGGERVLFETSWRLPSLGARLLEFRLEPVAAESAAGRIDGLYLFVNDLTERLRAEAELVHVSKMDAMGQLTGGVAHDFNNLLTIIGGNLELLQTEIAAARGSETAEIVDDALSAAHQGAELTEQLLAFARRQDLTPTSIDVGKVVDAAGRLLRRTLGRQILLRTEVEPKLPFARADRGKLENAILNLAINARDAMSGGGRLVISARSVVAPASGAHDTAHDNANGRARDNAHGSMKLAPGPYVALSVSDNGCGMDEEAARHAFEPFYTTKTHGHGTGLGLSMVYGFARQSGGDVALDTNPGRGTMLTIYLPALARREDPASRRGAAAADSRQASGTVLLVEDEERVRRLASRSLRQLGYAVVEVDNASEALALIEDGVAVDLVFSDIVMPGAMNGSDLAAEIARRWPELPVVLASGCRPIDDAAAEWPVLRKPYTADQLSDALRRALPTMPRV